MSAGGIGSGFVLPPVGFGPGSQPLGEDDGLAYMAMPSGMRAYAPHVPEIADAAALGPVLGFLGDLAAACARAAEGREQGAQFPLTGFAPAARRLIADALGSGEVSLRLGRLAAQESVFAGVWVLSGEGPDRVEVGAVPAAALSRAFEPERPALRQAAPLNDGVFNAPPVLTELLDKAASHRPDSTRDAAPDTAEAHVVNLSLLPHTPEDLDWLDAALGSGSARFLSRGYGNCTVTATAVAPVWRVRFFNSTEVLILDTFEVTAMPQVVLAAPEDLADSAARLAQVREAMA